MSRMLLLMMLLLIEAFGVDAGVVLCCKPTTYFESKDCA
jgi:hypothetical protein